VSGLSFSELTETFEQGSEQRFEQNSRIQLDERWLSLLEDEFARPYMHDLRAFLRQRTQAGAVIYPPGSEYFSALNSTSIERVKVVILGQDPYHGPGQAHGLCFSVRRGVAVPPSLRNIFEELKRDLGLPLPRHGCLQHWAEQGVLLLNAVLTVEAGQAAAHAGKGWEPFTDRIVRELSERRSNLVFLLWGSYAQKKGAVIDRSRHRVLESPHPSPLSAHRGFVGCAHFSQANQYLVDYGHAPIDWTVPD